MIIHIYIYIYDKMLTCMRRQLLDLSEVADLFMADHPGWLRRDLSAPPPDNKPRRQRRAMMKSL